MSCLMCRYHFQDPFLIVTCKLRDIGLVGWNERRWTHQDKAAARQSRKPKIQHRQADWQQAFDPGSGSYYFYNEVLQLTQWDEPDSTFVPDETVQYYLCTGDAVPYSQWKAALSLTQPADASTHCESGNQHVAAAANCSLADEDAQSPAAAAGAERSAASVATRLHAELFSAQAASCCEADEGCSMPRTAAQQPAGTDSSGGTAEATAAVTGLAEAALAGDLPVPASDASDIASAATAAAAALTEGIDATEAVAASSSGGGGAASAPHVDSAQAELHGQTGAQPARQGTDAAQLAHASGALPMGGHPAALERPATPAAAAQGGDADVPAAVRFSPKKKGELPGHVERYWLARYSLLSRWCEGVRLDETGLFSITPEVIAKHHAAVLGRCGVVLDAFCGCGGNAIQLALAGNRVCPDLQVTLGLHFVCLRQFLQKVAWHTANAHMLNRGCDLCMSRCKSVPCSLVWLFMLCCAQQTSSDSVTVRHIHGACRCSLLTPMPSSWAWQGTMQLCTECMTASTLWLATHSSTHGVPMWTQCSCRRLGVAHKAEAVHSCLMPPCRSPA